jgi:endonuclease/exonuclease/phosphatase family metal-dependent hydrolase
MRYIAYLSSALVIVGLILAYSAPIWSPISWWLPAFAGLVFPALFFACCVLALIWALTKSRYFFLILICLLPGILISGRFVRFFGAEPATQNEEIRVMSWNVHVFNKHFPANFEGRDQMLDIIREKDPDILCLQEFFGVRTHPDNDHIERITQLGYPYHYFQKFLTVSNDEWGIVIFSKYEIENAAAIEFSDIGHHNGAIYADVAFPDGKLRVYNVHLQSVYLTDEDLKGANSKDRISTLSKLKRAFAMRASQANEVSESLEASELPTILCGDFNDTPMSYTYNKIKGDLKDAFQQKGKGLGRSHAGLPGLRIDYAFSDDAFEVSGYEALRSGFSDHWPIIVDYKWN